MPPKKVILAKEKDENTKKSPLTVVSRWFKNLLLKVSSQDQLIFVKNLSIMVKAGLPVLDSLKMIQKEAKSRALKKILANVVDDVSNGQYLSTSFDKYRSIFGDLFINILAVGESSGILSENLLYLAEELKKRSELRRKIIGALVYPAVILFATFGITGLLMIFIFPKILPIFKTLNVTLPITTRILISVSNILTEQGPAAVLVVAVFVVIMWLLLKIQKIRYWYHFLLLRAPIFGKMFRNASLTNINRTLGITLKSGVKIVEAVSITAQTLSNLVYQKNLLEVVEKIKRGETISGYLYPHTFLFPPMMAQMVSVGENTGNLSETLLYLSEFYEAELGDLTKNLSNVLEPVLMVVMGVMVGFVAISIITPIYEVTSTFGGR
ncbi:MAG: type II secretion system F family protein [Patescibacteria group bacterium]